MGTEKEAANELKQEENLEIKQNIDSAGDDNNIEKSNTEEVEQKEKQIEEGQLKEQTAEQANIDNENAANNTTNAEDNKSDKCVNCGAELPPDVQFCLQCGHKIGAEVIDKEKIDQFNAQTIKKKKGKRKKTIIIISSVLLFIITALVVSYLLYFRPSEKYNNALELYKDGKYEEAIEIFEELDGFKDSEKKIALCEEGIKKDKYDSAIELKENFKYAQAINIFEELDGYEDSESQITEIKETCYKGMITTYGLIDTGYYVDLRLALEVCLVLQTSYLYDASDYLAMSNLYSGNSYRTYYYTSRYNNGYKYIVEYDTAQDFVELLNSSNDNMDDIELLMLTLTDVPSEYTELANALKDVYDTYKSFHAYVKNEPSVGYSSYASVISDYIDDLEAVCKAVETIDPSFADVTEDE